MKVLLHSFLIVVLVCFLCGASAPDEYMILSFDNLFPTSPTSVVFDRSMQIWGNLALLPEKSMNVDAQKEYQAMLGNLVLLKNSVHKMILLHHHTPHADDRAFMLHIFSEIRKHLASSSLPDEYRALSLQMLNEIEQAVRSICPTASDVQDSFAA